MNIHKAEGYRKEILALLQAEKLAVDDLPETLENFRVVLHNGDFIAVAGFEIYGDNALLRSIAVNKGFRNLGIAAKLIHRMEVLTGIKELHEMYLLTETAADYFVRHGYKTISRDDVPELVKQSAQFNGACPETAIVMKKFINEL